MGGVDLSDQMVAYYDTKRRSLKNWRPIFYFCLDRAVENTRILFNIHHKYLYPNARQSSALTFRQMLAKTFLHLRTKPGNSKLLLKPATILSSNDSHSSYPTVAQYLSNHILKVTQGRHCCAHCQKQGRRTEPHTICSGCNIGLCLECYTPWHLKKLE